MACGREGDLKPAWRASFRANSASERERLAVVGDPASLKFLPVGVGQRALGALKAGQVDALSLWDAAYAQIETSGMDVNLKHWRPASLENVGDGGYFTTWDQIHKIPNTLAHFTRAIAKSMVAIHDNPARALEIYWEVNPSGKPKGSDAEAHKRASRSSRCSAAPSTSRACRRRLTCRA